MTIFPHTRIGPGGPPYTAHCRVFVAVLICGIIGWRSLAGKIATIPSAILLIASLHLFLLTEMASMHRDFGGMPSIERVTSEAAAHNSLGRTLANQGRLDEGIKATVSRSATDPARQPRRTTISARSSPAWAGAMRR